MSSPAASEQTEFIFPYKRVDGPMGDSIENVMDFQRLNNAVARTTVEYVGMGELEPGHIEQTDAEIVADGFLNLEDVR